MALFDKIASFFDAPRRLTGGEVQKSGSISTPGFGSLGYALGFIPSSTGVPATPFSALQTAVYACVRAISQDISKLPLQVYKSLPGGGSAVTKSVPLARLLRAPNEWDTTVDFVDHIVFNYSLYGEAFVWVLRNNAGAPVELLPLSPPHVTVLLNTQSGSTYYHVSHPRFADIAQTVLSEDMIHIRNVSMDSGVHGLSPIAVGQEILGIAQANQRHAALMFRQGATLRGVVETDGILSPEAQANVSNSIAQTYSGNDNAHKIAVLEEGLKFKAVGMTAVDTQLLESRKYSANEIARLFRVPLHKIGASETTITNYEQVEQAYIEDTLLPICRKIEENFERKLLFVAQRDTLSIRFDLDSMARADMKSRYESYQIGTLNGWLNVNEVREKENLPPVEGGDTYRIPMNQQALESDSAIGAAMTNPNGGPANDANQRRPIRPRPTDYEDAPEKPEAPESERDLSDE